MKKIFTLLSVVLATTGAFAQNDVEASATDNWFGFMNVFDLPANGGAYQFGSFWAIDDIKTTLDVGAGTITLQPNFNTYANNPTDPYWVDQATGDGNKWMEGTTLVEPGPGFNGTDLTFSGNVLSNTLDAGYTANFFIKALDSTNGYADALNGTKVMTLPASGAFTVSATAGELPTGLIVQYGFIITGPNGDPLEEAQLGSVVIGMEDTSNLDEIDEASVVVFPNPANDVLNIASDYLVSNVALYDLSGKLVLDAGQTSTVDIASLHAGAYMVRISTDSGVLVKRVIKK